MSSAFPFLLSTAIVRAAFGGKGVEFMSLIFIDLAALHDPLSPEFPRPEVSETLFQAEREGWLIIFLSARLSHEQPEIDWWLRFHRLEQGFLHQARPLYLRPSLYRSFHPIYWKMQTVRSLTRHYRPMPKGSMWRLMAGGTEESAARSFFYVDPDGSSQRAISCSIPGAIVLPDLRPFELV